MSLISPFERLYALFFAFLPTFGALEINDGMPYQFHVDNYLE